MEKIGKPFCKGFFSGMKTETKHFKQLIKIGLSSIIFISLKKKKKEVGFSSCKIG